MDQSEMFAVASAEAASTEARLHDLRREASEVERRLSALRKILEGLTELGYAPASEALHKTETETETETTMPHSGLEMVGGSNGTAVVREGVVKVLREATTRMSASDIVDALAADGALPSADTPPDSIRKILSRMDLPRERRDGRSFWYLPLTQLPSQTETGDLLAEEAVS